MGTDDTFFNGGSGGGGGGGDRTVMRPMPGGRGRKPEGQPPPPPQQSSPYSEPVSIRGSGLNPLVNAATSILTLVGQLRNTTSHPDVANLRNHVVQEIKNFENETRSQGNPQELVLAARYILCTLIDEIVLSTPWGSNSVWSEQSLLSMFHNETWGGEKFFLMLDRMTQEPARHLHMLELLEICLALGFEGKYRVLDRGRDKLYEIQDNLYRAIRLQRGDFERELAPHWEGVRDKRSALVRYVPLWVVGAIACALLLVVYFNFSITLNDTTYPVYERFGKIGRTPLPSVSRVTEAPAPVQHKISQFLQPDIDQGLVDVIENADKTDIVIRGDGLFPSGSASVNSQFYPLIGRIAEALNKVPGQVLVIGHTDNVPIRSFKFKSNWDLSRMRAEDVLKILQRGVKAPARLIADGLADTQPLVPNNSSENRARNRRVVITLVTRNS